MSDLLSRKAVMFLAAELNPGLIFLKERKRKRNESRCDKEFPNKRILVIRIRLILSEDKKKERKTKEK